MQLTFVFTVACCYGGKPESGYKLVIARALGGTRDLCDISMATYCTQLSGAKRPRASVQYIA